MVIHVLSMAAIVVRRWLMTKAVLNSRYQKIRRVILFRCNRRVMHNRKRIAPLKPRNTTLRVT